MEGRINFDGRDGDIVLCEKQSKEKIDKKSIRVPNHCFTHDV